MSTVTSTHQNTALKVPFNEKDQAKSLGARWNAESKHWYVPQGVDAAPFEKWFTTQPTLTTTQQGTGTFKGTKAVLSVSDQSFEDDIDAINARLREAYESNDGDIF